MNDMELILLVCLTVSRVYLHIMGHLKATYFLQFEKALLEKQI